ncbi:MAG: lytic transglycosylase domain-containing protein [Peptococcaceae bacterium]|nr:lytic transglycosylase domain-containing protein [Peptococcaceae bacterium]
MGFGLLCLTLGFNQRDRWLALFNKPPYYAEIVAQCEELEEDPQLVLALIYAESGFNPAAKSGKGAVGLMQVMPETAAWVASRRQLPDYTPESLAEPARNLDIGIWYFHWLRQQFPDGAEQALAAYNAGPTRVRGWLTEGIWDGSRQNLAGIPYKETREYVERVCRRYEWYRKIFPL